MSEKEIFGLSGEEEILAEQAVEREEDEEEKE